MLWNFLSSWETPLSLSEIPSFYPQFCSLRFFLALTSTFVVDCSTQTWAKADKKADFAALVRGEPGRQTAWAIISVSRVPQEKLFGVAAPP
jgi:hypothetical protein